MTTPAFEGKLDAAVIVALGCSLPCAYGGRRALLDAALAALPAVGVEVVARSTWWRSAACCSSSSVNGSMVPPGLSLFATCPPRHRRLG